MSSSFTSDEPGLQTGVLQLSLQQALKVAVLRDGQRMCDTPHSMKKSARVPLNAGPGDGEMRATLFSLAALADSQRDLFQIPAPSVAQAPAGLQGVWVGPDARRTPPAFIRPALDASYEEPTRNPSMFVLPLS